jgi:hypothetical protein
MMIPSRAYRWPPASASGRKGGRERLIKIGAKVVSHAKAVTFQLAEVAAPRALFAAFLGRIADLRVLDPETG